MISSSKHRKTLIIECDECDVLWCFEDVFWICKGFLNLRWFLFSMPRFHKLLAVVFQLVSKPFFPDFFRPNIKLYISFKTKIYYAIYVWIGATPTCTTIHFSGLVFFLLGSIHSLNTTTPRRTINGILLYIAILHNYRGSRLNSMNS